MANILPLKGKYYGTEVALETGEIITVWVGPNKNYIASERERINGWGPGDGFDHVESARDYKISQIICEALTKAGF